jgi:hypothetical protein
MIINQIRIFLAISLTPLLLGCAASRLKSALKPDADTPVKIVSIFDCTVNSIPVPEKFEGNVSREVVKKLKKAFKYEINAKGRVEFTNEIDIVGGGTDSLRWNPVVLENPNRPDSADSPAGPDDWNQDEIDGIVYAICRTGYLRATDSLWRGDLDEAFTDKNKLAEIRMLRAATGADYCVVNSIYGTIRRQPLSMGVKVGVAVATGIISLLSPVGGVIVVPGDETVFKSASLLINLATGRVEWSRNFDVWQLYAVENIERNLWAQKVFRKFDIKKAESVTGVNRNQ